jgi:hypothetical protein
MSVQAWRNGPPCPADRGAGPVRSMLVVVAFVNRVAVSCVEMVHVVVVSDRRMTAAVGVGVVGVVLGFDVRVGGAFVPVAGVAVVCVPVVEVVDVIVVLHRDMSARAVVHVGVLGVDVVGSGHCVSLHRPGPVCMDSHPTTIEDLLKCRSGLPSSNECISAQSVIGRPIFHINRFITLVGSGVSAAQVGGCFGWVPITLNSISCASHRYTPLSASSPLRVPITSSALVAAILITEVCGLLPPRSLG